MTKFHPKNATLFFYLVCLISLNILTIYVYNIREHTIAQSVVLFLIINLILYLIFSRGDHYFIVSSDKLTIKSRLRPWFKKSFLFSEVKNLEWKSKPKDGNFIRIEYEDGDTKSWGTNISKAQFDELKSIFLAS